MLVQTCGLERRSRKAIYPPYKKYQVPCGTYQSPHPPSPPAINLYSCFLGLQGNI